jgi:MYXO-CTERM domain-containing protein
MKMRLPAAVGLLFAAASSTSASLATLVYEPFDYPAGKLSAPGNVNATAPANENGYSNTNQWTKAGTAANDPDVIAGNLSYPNLPASTGGMAQLTGAGGTALTHDRIAIGDYGDGSTIYWSMIVKVPTGVASYGTSNTTGSFFTGFQFNPQMVGAVDNTMSDGAATAAAPLCVRAVTANSSTSGYQLGIAYRDAPAATARVFDSTPSHTFFGGDTVLLVGKFFIGAGNKDDVASLFINPDLTSGLEPVSPSVSSSVTSTSSTGFDYFWDASGTVENVNTIRSFHLRNNGVEPTNMQVDDIRIGTSWADVTAAPEPTAIGLIGVGALGLVRRRRAR